MSGSDPEPVLEAFAGVEALAVSGLDDATASELLRREAPHRVADDVASDLVATAHGNPLALTEIPRGLSPDQLAGREPLAGPVAAGERIEQAFARQLADLPEATREALLVAAAMQTGRYDLFAMALDKRGLPADALDPAISAGLIAIDGQHRLLPPAAALGDLPRGRPGARAARCTRRSRSCPAARPPGARGTWPRRPTRPTRRSRPRWRSPPARRAPAAG